MNLRLYSFVVGACISHTNYVRSFSVSNCRILSNFSGGRRPPLVVKEATRNGSPLSNMIMRGTSNGHGGPNGRGDIFSKFTDKNIQIPKSVTYVPRGKLQKDYVDSLANPDVSVVFGTGPAGCGKTLFACIAAIQSLKRGSISRIVFTRPLVPAEEDIGFLPGNIMKKMDPWLQPLYDIFLEHYTRKELDQMIANNVIEISPLGFMRGRTFKNAFIIADEMQNSSPNQIFMLLTRIGSGSKMVITGDLQQSDLQYRARQGQGQNGLYDFIHKMKLYSYTNILEEIRLIEMTADDVERSPVVRRVLEISDFAKKHPNDIL